MEVHSCVQGWSPCRVSIAFSASGSADELLIGLGAPRLASLMTKPGRPCGNKTLCRRTFPSKSRCSVWFARFVAARASFLDALSDPQLVNGPYGPQAQKAG